jgi:hypothetical protein
MKRFGLTLLAFIGGAIGGWISAIIAYIVYFEVTGSYDREGGTAMAVAFALGPLLGLITGLIAAVVTFGAVKPKT